MQHEKNEQQKKIANTMENERFELQNVADTVEMAASSSKMLKIAMKTGGKANPPPKKNGKTTVIPKTIPDPYLKQ